MKKPDMKESTIQHSILFREHRGSLSESMETVIEIKSLKELQTHVEKILKPWGVENIKLIIEKYCYDKRIKWNSFIVVVENYGVIGFTNGEIS